MNKPLVTLNFIDNETGKTYIDVLENADNPIVITEKVLNMHKQLLVMNLVNNDVPDFETAAGITDSELAEGITKYDEQTKTLFEKLETQIIISY